MLSHRWKKKEPSLHEVQDKAIPELDSVEGTTKLQSFCKVVRNFEYHWAWVDTCCIDQKDNVEVQRSVNSMFTCYRPSALTIIYLSDCQLSRCIHMTWRLPICDRDRWVPHPDMLVDNRTADVQHKVAYSICRYQTNTKLSAASGVHRLRLFFAVIVETIQNWQR